MEETLIRKYEEIVNKTPEFAVERRCIALSKFDGAEIPEWIKGQTIYELYVRSFSKEGTFNAVTDQLEDLKEQGFNVIWFMPVFPVGKLNRKGKSGCPYAVRDYFTVNPEYGSESDFKRLVKKAHALDMKIMIDMVLNHVACDYNMLKELPGLTKKDEQGNPVRNVEEWSDVVDLDYAQRETWEHALEILKFWIIEYDIDGYRCDVAGMIPLIFWEWAFPELKKLKPDFFMLAEWQSQFLHKEVFHSSYDWNLYEIMLRINTGEEPASMLFDWQQLKTLVYPRNSLVMHFLENHDKPRAAQVLGPDKTIPFLVFNYTMPGAPLVYNGQENGAQKYLTLFDKDDMNREPTDEQIKTSYRQLNQLRQSYPAMWSDSYRVIENDFPDDVAIFEKAGPPLLLVLINFKETERAINLPVKLTERIQEGTVLFNSKPALQFNKSGMTLSALQAAIVKL